MPRSNEETYPIEIDVTVKLRADMPVKVRDNQIISWATDYANKQIKGAGQVIVNNVYRDRG